jgi:tRNA threonylcarbamoyladenosine biosynthesis protein TsaE
MLDDRANPPAQQSDPWVVASQDEDDTQRLGRALGEALARGGTVALVGPLGAGKTRLTQAIAVELGADRHSVNSPTFVLVQEYAATLPIFHCDTYRLKNIDEFLDLGIEEMFQAEGVCVIEWADRVAPVLPPDRLQIEIEVIGPTARTFRIRALGPRSSSVLDKARSAFDPSQESRS